MVSSKFLHDDGEEDEVFTDEWAKSGDITVSELCQLEKEFLKAIDWNIFVREPAFWNRLEQLESDIALREGSKRGWFTYTELKYLSNVYEFTHLVNTLVAVSAVLALTYAVGVATLAGSVFLTSRIPGTSLYTLKNDSNVLSLENEPIAADDQFNDTITEIDILLSNTLKYEMKPHKTLDAINVFKTSLILASITCNNGCETEDSDCSIVSSSWDWWNNPIMNWLSDISRNNENDGIRLPNNYYKNFAHDKLVDMSIANQKKIQLQDKIHKATKVRLQEQLERSWHEEWTDTVFMTLRPYFSQMSAY